MSLVISNVSLENSTTSDKIKGFLYDEKRGGTPVWWHIVGVITTFRRLSEKEYSVIHQDKDSGCVLCCQIKLPLYESKGLASGFHSKPEVATHGLRRKPNKNLHNINVKSKTS